MKDIFKKAVLSVANNLFIENLLKRQSKGPRVLFYHGVEKEINNKFVQSLHIPFKDFEKQILFLKNQYEIISIDDIYNSINDGYNLNNRQVSITFDDGYKNNLEVIFPFLDSLKIPFSVFISSKHIQTGDRFPTFMLRAGLSENKNSILELKSLGKKYSLNSKEDFAKSHIEIARIMKKNSQQVVDGIVQDIYESLPEEQWHNIFGKYHSDKPMDWDDVISLHKSGVIIGSHCHDHFISNKNQKEADIKHQLTFSKNLIEEKCGSCDYFCFPNGGVEDISAQAYLEAKNNFKLCFSTIAGELNKESDKYYLPRYGAVSDFEHFKFNMNASFMRNKDYTKKYNNFLKTLSSNV